MESGWCGKGRIFWRATVYLLFCKYRDKKCSPGAIHQWLRVRLIHLQIYFQAAINYKTINRSINVSECRICNCACVNGVELRLASITEIL